MLIRALFVALVHPLLRVPLEQGSAFRSDLLIRADLRGFGKAYQPRHMKTMKAPGGALLVNLYQPSCYIW